MTPRLADTVRANADALGFDLSHVPDDELGARLAAMPVRLTGDVEAVCRWLVYGTERPDHPSRPPTPPKETRS